MRLIGRNDLYLLLGLSVALFAIFSRPLGRVLDLAREIDQSWGLQLVPGLVILAVVFMFHQVRKRHEMRAAALAATAEVTQATVRASEMERLVNFGKALGQSLTLDSIQLVAVEHLPALAGGRVAWAMIGTSGSWRHLAIIGDVAPADCEEAARLALADTTDGTEVVAGGRFVCFPMIVAKAPVGVLGVSPAPPLTGHQRVVLAAAAALLAASLKNAELFQVVHENSIRDALTGCFNRQHALEILNTELRRSRRTRSPFSVMMVDLDHFKDVNDRFGHLCGDAVLSSVGRRMHTVLRVSDVKCRYGGEEFLVLLPDTTVAGATRVADVLRRDLEEHPVPWPAADRPPTDVRVTASFGITGTAAGEIDATAVLARADAALYRAKEQGRNRVCVTEDAVV
ncbi:MAG: sensor domain-containing diguanylate cyclase [Acidobacteria bacterium]|nr:sensor domain-containing diguanylate cyclase [Acidobacteriota bacterium]